MKHLLLYLLLACTLILPGACTHPTTPPVLLCADSLASANPDSAQALLASLAEEMKQEPQDVQMYYRLLCIKAKDKAYITHTSDSAILPVVEYYEREGDKKHLPEAYYYAGRVYRDLGDAPQALDYFEKALDAMQENENLKVKTKVYAQMGTLFSYQNLYEEALNMFKHSLQCDISLKDSIGMVFNYRDMADAYRSLKKPDSALYYYQKSYQLCQQLERKDLENMLQSQLASFFLDRGEYPQAQKALQHALQDIKSYNKSGIYSIAAHYYHDIDNIDSAQWYYNELLQCGSIYSKELAYRGLTNIMLRKGESIPAAEFLYQALLLGDSIHKITVTEDIRRSHALSKHQVREKENQRLKLQNLKQRQTGIFLIIAFALLAGSGILYYLRRGISQKPRVHGRKQQADTSTGKRHRKAETPAARQRPAKNGAGAENQHHRKYQPASGTGAGKTQDGRRAVLPVGHIRPVQAKGRGGKGTRTGGMGTTGQAAGHVVRPLHPKAVATGTAEGKRAAHLYAHQGAIQE